MDTHREFFGHALKTKKQLETDAPCLLHFLDICDEQSINSHTISKSCLSIISENHHLITPKPVPTKTNEERSTLFTKRGIKKASTYRGFCSAHDNSIFQKIDQIQDELDLDMIVRFFIRSLGQEYQKKIRAFVTLDSVKVFDSGLNDDDWYSYQVYGQRVGASLLWKQFKEAYYAIEGNLFSNFRYLTINFDQLYPFSYLGCYSHELEYMEVELGDKNPTNFRSCVMGLVPTKTGSSFFMGWHKDYSKFVSMFLNNLSLSKGGVPEFIFQHAIARSENIFINPLWYEEIGEQWRECIENYFSETTKFYIDFSYRAFPDLFGSQPYKLKLKSNALKVKNWARKKGFSNF